MANRDAVLQDAGLHITEPISLTDQVTLYRIPGGKKAVDLWHALVSRSRELGGWPVICGRPDDLDYLKEMVDKPELGAPDDILAKAAMPEVQAVAAQWASTEKNGTCSKPDFSFFPRAPLPKNKHIVAMAQGTGGPAPRECLLAITPAKNPWDVPAYLRFGAYNECPNPEVHVACLRGWYERYQAVPISMTHEVIETFVARPPMTRDESWTLACELERYCSDIVSQGTGTLEKLALVLWQAPYWWFWWD